MLKLRQLLKIVIETQKNISYKILTRRILISLPSRFCDLARFFLVIALIATTLLGACNRVGQMNYRNN